MILHNLKLPLVQSDSLCMISLASSRRLHYLLSEIKFNQSNKMITLEIYLETYSHSKLESKGTQIQKINESFNNPEAWSSISVLQFKSAENDD